MGSIPASRASFPDKNQELRNCNALQCDAETRYFWHCYCAKKCAAAEFRFLENLATIPSSQGTLQWQIVLCTNDSDMEPALEKIRSDFPQIEIGFIAAVPTPTNGTPEGRRPNKSLQNPAHWTRHSIRDDELAAAQMPEQINTGNGQVSMPEHW
ncbi:MAG: hypothetical protein JO269_01705 [Burkholderiaceae bacterium]|nr:hypothetical protein [Burkholderiaceae bacterium]